MPSIHALVADGRRRLAAAGIAPAEADLDARILAERLLDWDAARYFAHGDQPAMDAVVRGYRAFIDRRINREPLAYITGGQEFWGLRFEVGPAVLIPRPETELVIEASLEHYPEIQQPLRVADVCTGSGCLAVALARERPRARIVGTDISRDALAVAHRNVIRHGVTDGVRLLHADLLAGADGPFDLIVSNPPYVPAGDVARLQPEVVEHEPHLALFAGSDGLDVIRRLVGDAANHLAAGGLLVFECGYGQRDAVAELVDAAPGLELLAIRSDLQGIPRTAVARRH